MATITQAQVYIGGNLIPVFSKLILHQEIDAHHSFELVCRKDVLEKESSEILGESMEFLGETFLLRIESVNSFSEEEILEFKGVVTALNTVKGFYHQDGDYIHIFGKSTSIIIDDGPHYASHKEVMLSEILSRTFSGYNRGVLDYTIAPQNDTMIHYSVQQHESAFEYISRLAAQYGEWFYHDGKRLVFGKPNDQDIITLKYGHDLQKLSMNMEAIPNNYKYFTNDYLNDSFHQVRTKDLTTNVNGFVQFANKKSDRLYHKETQVFVSAHDNPDAKNRIDQQIVKQKQANEVNQIKVTGKSTNSGLKIGGIIAIDGDNASYGKYRITKIEHTYANNGNYTNEFEAVTASVDTYPKTSIKSFPKSKPQTAVVVSNADPEGLGRVQVQYAWQKPMGESTPWIRLSSTAGGSGQGFFFVPEVGDEVIIGYENNNAEIPYVQGSMYNASSIPDSFKSGNNHLKAIKTRSGNQVTLNDADGSVTIADPSGNTIVMAGNGEITINAPNKITLASTDIALEASNNLTVNAGSNINASAGSNFSANASSNLSLDAGSSLSASGGSKASLKGKTTSISGKRVSLTASVMANIQAGAALSLASLSIGIAAAAAAKILGGKIFMNGDRVEINK